VNSKIDFGNDKIHKIILKLAPPVMIGQLIQALYNIVDSLFIGRYDERGLTALSIIYPLQLLMIALAVGSGVGINSLINHYKGQNQNVKAKEVMGMATPIAIFSWLIFAGVTYLLLPVYVKLQTNDINIINYSLSYGKIVCLFSLGLFLESIWAKVMQADGKMILPMIDQIVGAIINIILDPLLIFTFNLGLIGAAIATVLGQFISAFIIFKGGFFKSPKLSVYKNHIFKIYKLGLPNIIMQSAYTFYIFGLNIILSGFSDAAVTTLGLYYKLQTFFFIPLGSLQTCIVPIISYNYAKMNIERCKKILNESIIIGIILMFIGTLCFEFIPIEMVSIFSSDNEVYNITNYAFRFIGISFIPMVTSLIFPVFFESVGYVIRSTILTIIRTVICFVPIGFILARLFGLYWFWLVYPITEIITTIVGYIFYFQFLKKHNKLMNSE